MARFLRAALKLLIIALAAYGAYRLFPASEPVVDVYYASDFASGPDGIVGFPSWNAGSAREVMAGGELSTHQTSGGLLVLPAEASPDNPVPAVVILHGSGGDWSGRSVYLANRLARHGIAGFAVDTFVARNLRPTDDYFTRLEKASIYTQIVDGLMALQALQQHPAIRGDQVAVAGFSLGAASALYSMFEPVTEAVLGEQGARFSAYASFYSGCSFDFEDFRVQGGPVLLMMGEADESMSIPRCEWFRDKLLDHGVQAQLAVYPGAGHGWELPYPQAFKPGLAVTKDCLITWTREGENIEMNSGRSIDTTLGAILAFSRCSHRDGYTMGRNEAAMEQSWQDFYGFLTRTWSAGPAPRPLPVPK